MVETGAPLLEAVRRIGAAMAVQRQDRPRRELEDRVMESVVMTVKCRYLLVEDRFPAQQPLVPGTTGCQIGDGERDVVEAGGKFVGVLIGCSHEPIVGAGDRVRFG